MNLSSIENGLHRLRLKIWLLFYYATFSILVKQTKYHIYVPLYQHIFLQCDNLVNVHKYLKYK